TPQKAGKLDHVGGLIPNGWEFGFAEQRERGAEYASNFCVFVSQDSKLAVVVRTLAVNEGHRCFGDAFDHLLALDLKMAAHPCVPSRPWVIFGGIRRGLRGGRRCVSDSLEYQTSVGVGFAHGRSPNRLACLLGHELVVRGAQRSNLVSGDHGRLACLTILFNSSRITACAACHCARSGSGAARWSSRA